MLSTAKELERFVGRRITEIEYGDMGDTSAYIILDDGSAIEINVEPTYTEGEEGEE